jgi:hypothetical protein
MPKTMHMIIPIALAATAATVLARGCPRWAPSRGVVFEQSLRVLDHQLTLGATIRRLDDGVRVPDPSPVCEVTVDTVYVLVVPTTRSAGGAQ